MINTDVNRPRGRYVSGEEPTPMTSSTSADAPRASVEQILAEYQDLQEKLNDPGVHSD